MQGDRPPDANSRKIVRQNRAGRVWEDGVDVFSRSRMRAIAHEPHLALARWLGFGCRNATELWRRPPRQELYTRALHARCGRMGRPGRRRPNGSAEQQPRRKPPLGAHRWRASWNRPPAINLQRRPTTVNSVAAVLKPACQLARTRSRLVLTASRQNGPIRKAAVRSRRPGWKKVRRRKS